MTGLQRRRRKLIDLHYADKIGADLLAERETDLDTDAIWQEATESERWVIASDLLDDITTYPDNLEVNVSRVPGLIILLEEVGLTGGRRTPSASLRSAPPPEGEERGERVVFQRVGERTSDRSDPGWRITAWCDLSRRT